MTQIARTKSKVDGRTARLHRAAERSSRIDAQPMRPGDVAPRFDLVRRQMQLGDLLARRDDFRGAHLSEILRAQYFRGRHGEARVEFDRGLLLGVDARRLEKGLGDPARASLRLFLFFGRLSDRRHHRNELFEKAAALPKDTEGLIEQNRMFVLLDKDRMKRRIEIRAIADASRLYRRQSVEYGARAYRKARLAQSAREIENVLGQLAGAGRFVRVHSMGGSLQDFQAPKAAVAILHRRIAYRIARVSARTVSISSAVLAPSIFAISS